MFLTIGTFGIVFLLFVTAAIAIAIAFEIKRRNNPREPSPGGTGVIRSADRGGRLKWFDKETVFALYFAWYGIKDQELLEDLLLLLGRNKSSFLAKVKAFEDFGQSSGGMRISFHDRGIYNLWDEVDQGVMSSYCTESLEQLFGDDAVEILELFKTSL